MKTQERTQEIQITKILGRTNGLLTIIAVLLGILLLLSIFIWFTIVGANIGLDVIYDRLGHMRVY